MNARSPAPEVTHLVPETGHPLFRTSLCGVPCSQGRFEHERETHGLGTSTREYADCPECLELAESAHPLKASK